MKLHELLTACTRRFEEAGFDSPAVEAAYLLEYAVGIRHTHFALHRGLELSEAQLERARDYLKRRLADEPFQYICGWTDFREIRLNVAPGCLIPRPETEMLVELALSDLPRGACVCEPGTGSGAIALSIAWERPDTLVYATELSPDAFRIASANREALRLENVHLLQGDLFAPLPRDVKFELLAANLPYIPESARADLPRNVRDYEPEMALFAPREGRGLIERALREAPPRLADGAVLLFETGSEQGPALSDYAASLGCYADVQVLRDQYGENRFLRCKFRGDRL